MNDIPLSEFQPIPKLVVKSTSVTQPKFPVIDAHNYLEQAVGGGQFSREDYDAILAEMRMMKLVG